MEPSETWRVAVKVAVKINVWCPFGGSVEIIIYHVNIITKIANKCFGLLSSKRPSLLGHISSAWCLAPINSIWRNQLPLIGMCCRRKWKSIEAKQSHSIYFSLPDKISQRTIRGAVWQNFQNAGVVLSKAIIHPDAEIARNEAQSNESEIGHSKWFQEEYYKTAKRENYTKYRKQNLKKEGWLWGISLEIVHYIITSNQSKAMNGFTEHYVSDNNVVPTYCCCYGACRYSSLRCGQYIAFGVVVTT